MWGEMRMNPTDLADVLAHLHLSDERHRAGWQLDGPLQIWRASPATVHQRIGDVVFRRPIPGLKMTVAADGQYVHPVTVDEFRIATAKPTTSSSNPPARTYSRSSRSPWIERASPRALAVREGLRAAVPGSTPGRC